MAASATEQRELELVEKLEFRILNVANNEKKLQELLTKFLAPLLLKGASEHASVRIKVARLAQRLKLFIQPPGVILPVSVLLKQFKTTDSAVVKHLDITFIQHSIGRLPDKERRDLMPDLLRGISKVSSGTPALFEIFLKSLPVLKIPPRGSSEDASFQQDIGLSDPEDAAYVAEHLGQIFLLSRSRQGLDQSQAEFFFYNQDDSWIRTGTNLADTRIRAANFLASGAFTDEQRFMPAVYASVQTDSRVSSVGEELIKRSTVSFENDEIVSKLFKAHAELPIFYHVPILNLLTRSVLSTTHDDKVLALVQRDLAKGEDEMEVDTPQTLHGSPVSIASGRLEIVKLHTALFKYINWVARWMRNQESTVAQTLVHYLQDYIMLQGWPEAKISDKEVPLRALAYETIGMLTKKLPKTDDQIDLVYWFFRALTEDTLDEIVVNIDGALSSMTSTFAISDGSYDLSQEMEKKLHSLLLHFINLTEDEPLVRRSARHAAAKWANNCLRFDDPIARWIDILAVAGHRGERSDVVEEGHRGLDPWTYYSNNTDSMTLPSWCSLVAMFSDLSTEDWATCGADPNKGHLLVDEGSIFYNFQGEKIDAFPVAVQYCLHMMMLSILPEFKIVPGWEQQLDTHVRTSVESRAKIRHALIPEELVQRLGKIDDAFATCLLKASFAGMLHKKTSIAEPCGRYFVQLASMAPANLIGILAKRADELRPLVQSNNKETRKIGAAAIGILGAHLDLPSEAVEQLKNALLPASKDWKTAVGSQLNAAEGAFLALGHLLSRRIFYGSHVEEDFAIQTCSIFPSPEELAGASVSFRDTIFDALSQVWTARIFDGTSSNVQTEMTALLSTHAKKGNEHAITALGRLAIAVGNDAVSTEKEDTDDITKTILDKLYELYELKQVESHFAIGDAVSAAILCHDSEEVQLSIDVEALSTHGPYKLPLRQARLTVTLDKILADCKTTKPSLLKASGIWLFSILQNCKNVQGIDKRLRECQAAFMRLLSARDELVQETASRGLSLVYEMGNEELKSQLVKDLVASFTGSSTQLKVDEETELFEAGALPTGDGKSVTSYRDIVNLANEVGDQSLIYRFMSLAANAATWSTRSAFGRFGLSSILSDSEVDPKLYPKLFRYRFDPNPNVRRSMEDIWKALVKDPAEVIETHFDTIMEDLLKSILGKEWRVRQASCAAIADLVQGQQFSKYGKFYEDMWSRALKVLDDVKGSVREAALGLCMTLSKTLVRQLEEGSGSNSSSAQSMMNEALPFLMSERGMESGVEDVKIFATVTVLKIAKHGGKALRPYIAGMATHLLGLLSTIEPQALNYYYMRSGEDTKEKLDKMRSAMVSQSPIVEAIENCLRQVDGSVMEQLAPGLEEAMKTAVGMPSKIGCSRVLVTLATRHSTDFAPYASRLLRQLEKQALDRNDEVSQNYAKAAAYVMRVAPDEARVHFVERYVELYFAAEDEHRRQKVADAVLALAKISPDHFSTLESRLLSFAYVASHDTDDYVHKACEEVWSKHAGSDLSVARYVPEIAALVSRCIESPQWALKHAGALTASDAVKAVVGASTVSGQVSPRQLQALWPLYERALALKTFAGKEKLLEVLPDFVRKARQLWTEDAKMAASLRKIATVEAKRNNETYREHAFRCLWRVAAERDDIDMWADVVTIVTPHLKAYEESQKSQGSQGSRGGGGDRMDLDSVKKKSDTERLVQRTAENAVDAIARSYSRPALKKNPAAVLAAIQTALAPFLGSDTFGVVRRTTWYKAATDLFTAAAEAADETNSKESGEAGPLILSYLASLDMKNAEVGTEEQRSTRAKAVKALVEAAKKGALGSTTTKDYAAALATIRGTLQAALAVERSLDVQKLLKEALAVV